MNPVISHAFSSNVAAIQTYGGMQTSPMVLTGEQCIAQTKNNTQCKLKACTGSLYCFKHHEMYKYDKPNERAICTEALDAQQRPTKCGHYLHPKCLDRWLQTHITCPICRTQLKKEPQVIDYVQLAAQATQTVMRTLEEQGQFQQFFQELVMYASEVLADTQD